MTRRVLRIGSALLLGLLPLVLPGSARAGDAPAAESTDVPPGLIGLLEPPAPDGAVLSLAAMADAWQREALGLAAALVFGMLLTLRPRSRANGESDEQRAMRFTLILLCMAGALMMIIVGNSLARAFSIAGAASLVRFRSNLTDPREGAFLLLVLGVGMACGLGQIGTAAVATVIVLAVVAVMERVETRRAKRRIDLTIEGPEARRVRDAVGDLVAARGFECAVRAEGAGPEPWVSLELRVPASLDPGSLAREVEDALGDGAALLAWGSGGKKRRRTSAA